jgi:diacylglycerol kinase family enzyme
MKGSAPNVPSRRPSLRRRLAAVVAIAVPLLGLQLAIDLLQQPLNLAVLIVCITGGALSVWYMLTRRGVLRWVALVGVIPLLLLGFVLGIGPFVEVLVLLLVFGAAGGYAIGADARTLLANAYPPRDVEPAQRGVVIINPNSGGGKATRFDLVGQARKRGVQTVTLVPGDDLTQVAEQAIASGADAIGMAGGDGSQALVASVAMRLDIPFVCVPSGTRNHFALDLGLDRKDVIGALDAFTDGVERTIDLACVNDRVFVNNASLGLYARVVQSSAYRNAKVGTWVRMLPDMLGPGASPVDLEFKGPHARHYAGAPLVMVSNNPYHLSRISRSVTRPRLDTGHLGILATRVADRAIFTAIGPARYGRVLEWSQASFEVHSSAPVPIGVDGEALVLDPPLRFVSLPAALRVRLPRNSPGVLRRRDKATLTKHDLLALLRIAAGRPTVASPAATTAR